MARRNLFLGILLAAACGCMPKLNAEGTLTDVDFNGKEIIIPAIKKEQKVSVSATAAGGKIDVFVFLEANKDAAEKEIIQKRIGASVLAHELGKETVMMSATIPAGQSAIVKFAASAVKKANVSYRLTNQN